MEQGAGCATQPASAEPGGPLPAACAKGGAAVVQQGPGSGVGYEARAGVQQRRPWSAGGAAHCAVFALRRRARQLQQRDALQAGRSARRERACVRSEPHEHRERLRRDVDLVRALRGVLARGRVRGRRRRARAVAGRRARGRARRRARLRRAGARVAGAGRRGMQAPARTRSGTVAP